MAQKAAKSLATRNAATLQRTHLISAAVHALFLLAWLLLSRLLLRRTLMPYVLLSAPAVAIEAYLHVLGQPKFSPVDGSLVRAGEDLEAKGLTEYMWDVVYWTWINLILVTLFGNTAWWLYLVVPGYSAYAIATTVGGLKAMFSGVGGAGGEGEGMSTGESKRQKKLEKRGGQRVAYR